MRKLALLVTAILFAAPTFAQVHVDGYTRRDGTYVQPHYRSSPNSTVTDNYSFKGNTNPYTGSVGTNTYRNNPTSPYYGGTTNRNNYGNSNNNYGNSGSRSIYGH